MSSIEIKHGRIVCKDCGGLHGINMACMGGPASVVTLSARLKMVIECHGVISGIASEAAELIARSMVEG